MRFVFLLKETIIKTNNEKNVQLNPTFNDDLGEGGRGLPAGLERGRLVDIRQVNQDGLYGKAAINQ